MTGKAGATRTLRALQSSQVDVYLLRPDRIDYFAHFCSEPDATPMDASLNIPSVCSRLFLTCKKVRRDGPLWVKNSFTTFPLLNDAYVQLSSPFHPEGISPRRHRNGNSVEPDNSQISDRVKTRETLAKTQ